MILTTIYTLNAMIAATSENFIPVLLMAPRFISYECVKLKKFCCKNKAT